MGRTILVLALLSFETVAASILARDATTNLKERPVMKVVRLLQDMEAELNRELEDDKAVHEKLGCWCKENDQEKTKAIELGDATVEQLKASMSEFVAMIVELKEKHRATVAEVDADHAALTKANALRMKENQEFHGEEADLIEAVKACKQAIVVLAEYHPELAQIREVARTLQNAQVPQLVLHSGGLRKEELDILKGFLGHAQSASSFLAIPGYTSYAPQSGQIFGILKRMQKDFEDNLSAQQKAELKAQEIYEALKAAKEDEIASGKKAIAKIDESLAQFSEKHAQAAKEFEDTKAQLELDRAFLADLKKKCSETEAEYEGRVKDRMDEISAVKDTIEIINSDAAFDNFDKTMNVDGDHAYDVFDKSVNMAFLQTTSVTSQEEQMLRRQASSVLRLAAVRNAAPQLALLAASAQLDAFTKVKEEIDKLVTQLQKQQTDEVTQRDWCISEFAANSRSTAAGDDQKSNLLSKIADLEKTIEQLTAKIDIATADIAEMQKQMKRASENREGANSVFHETILDQRLTQQILRKALARMKEVYALMQQSDDGAEQPGAAHVWTSGTHTDAGNGPARFKNYHEHASGSRVVKMIEVIIASSVKMEDDAIVAEQDSQAEYESFMQDSNRGIKNLQESIVHMSESRAKAKAAHSMAKTDFKQTMTELEGLNFVLGDLHKSCDFLIKNFDVRQEARTAEMDALNDAKAILSGMQKTE